MERYLIGGDAEKFLWVSVMTRIYENGLRIERKSPLALRKIYENNGCMLYIWKDAKL